jgi:hypothetical protein
LNTELPGGRAARELFCVDCYDFELRDPNSGG